MDAGELMVVGLAMLAGAAVQGTVGFGLNLLAAPIVALVEPRLVPGPLLVSALVLTVLMAHRERASLDFHGIRWAVVGRLPGTVLGAWAVASLPEDRLALAFAVAVLSGVAMSAAGRRFRPTTGTLLGAGFVSGLMGTASSIGGPPMALVYQDSPGAQLRGTLAGYFVLGASISIAVLALFGRFGAQEVGLSLVTLPGLLAGFVLSRWTTGPIDRGRARVAVLAVSSLAAVALIVERVVF